MRPQSWMLPLGLVSLVLVALGSPRSYGMNVEIEYFQNAFIPTSATITAGDSVTWIWVAGAHTVTSGLSSDPADDPGTLFDAPIDASNPSFTYTFGVPGVYSFFDRLHETGLVGTITVNPFEVVAGVVNNAFTPADLVIFQGDRVRWQWIEGTHTVTSGASSNPADDPGAMFQAPSTAGQPVFIHVFDTPGHFPYFCIPHELFGMAGSVRVQRVFIRGDYNADGGVDVADPVALLGHLFAGVPLATCPDAGDANDDGSLDIADAVSVLAYLFGGAAVLPAPFPNSGPDRTPDGLLCE